VIASRFSFAAIFAYRVRLRRWWYRRTSSGMAHQPVEVRTRPQHNVIIRYVFAVIALADALPKPVTDLAFMLVAARGPGLGVRPRKNPHEAGL